MASVFGSGVGDYNREMKAAGDWAIWKLGPQAIQNRFAMQQDLMAPMLAGMGQAAQVGANMDTQAMTANLARQGLGGTGLGVALGGGLRSGATLANNRLRAQMAAEAMNQAIGLQSAQANLIMQRAAGQQPEAGAGAYWTDRALQATGMALQTASLFGGNEDDED